MSVLVVAELSGNHGGSLWDALTLVEAAAKAGADAIKLQTFEPELLAVQGYVLDSGPWKGRELRDLYREVHTLREWHRPLFERAHEWGLQAFSSPFDPTAVDFLETLACPIYKIASFEVSDVPLLERVAATGKPVILSTGVASDAEIERALRILTPNEVTLLHCVSEYPAATEDMDLTRMVDLERRFSCQVGLSDHSLTPTAAVCAVALGATVIEKHLTLSRSRGGPDDGFSIEPEEFAHTVAMIREAHAATRGRAAPRSTNAGLKKGLWVVQDVAAGEQITPQNVRVLRPGGGLAPERYAAVLKQRFSRAAARNSPLLEEHLCP